MTVTTNEADTFTLEREKLDDVETVVMSLPLPTITQELASINTRANTKADTKNSSPITTNASKNLRIKISKSGINLKRKVIKAGMT